ncbi:MAG: hypothetical protein ACM3SS_16730 [Rhodospirillaceae bacterium]
MIRHSLRTHARNAVTTGTVAGLASLATAVVCARRQHGRPAAPVNAVSHIWSGRHPLPHALAPTPRNALIGLLLHQGASVFWASFFEPLFGGRAERSTAAAIVGGISVSAAAYVTDYHIVSPRFRPGFEVSVTGRSLFLVYAARAAGFAAAARLRGLRHHQVENDDERHEGRNA